MTNDERQVQDAADLLSQLLDQQTRLTIEQAEANRLASESLAQKQRELDLQAQGQALQRETMNRAERRLHEVLIRYITAAEKMITLDDAFGETVQRLIEANREIRDNLHDLETAVYALLSRDMAEVGAAQGALKSRRTRDSLREELKQRYQNLGDLQLKAAKFGSMNEPLSLSNEIEAERRRIEEIEQKLHE